MAAFGLSIGGTNAAVGVLRVSPRSRKGKRRMCEIDLFLFFALYWNVTWQTLSCMVIVSLSLLAEEKRKREKENEETERWEEIATDTHLFSLLFPLYPYLRTAARTLRPTLQVNGSRLASSPTRTLTR